MSAPVNVENAVEVMIEFIARDSPAYDGTLALVIWHRRSSNIAVIDLAILSNIG